MDGPERIAVAAVGFPDDSLVEILSCVPAKSLGRFKCVSKAWRDLIVDRLRCRKFPQILEGFFYGGRGQNYGNFTNLEGKSVPLVDPSFSFLTKVPGIEDLVILSSHNGLLLIGHTMGSVTCGYIVCNPRHRAMGGLSLPAKKCNCKGDEDEKSHDDDERSDEDEESDEDDEDDEESDEDDLRTGAHHFLIFDPAVSSHFHLLQFGHYCCDEMLFDVSVYSSETGLWSCKTAEWAGNVETGECERWLGGEDEVKFELGRAYVNGMLHIPVYHHYGYHLQTKEAQIVVVDVQGNLSRIMRWPGQSQGRLHCISGHRKSEDPNGHIIGLSIWVLEDYDAEQWVLKQNLSVLSKKH
ncbi:hypothetical protein EJB05_15525, partial [Eragrostis curvula]